MRPTATTTDADRPFRDAIGLTPRGDGRFAAELGTRFTVGTKAHGGLLMVLLARAGLARVDTERPGAAPDPLVIAADYLRAPDPGPVELDTELLKLGRTASVVAVRMRQDGRLVLAATVTAGRLPDDGVRWSDLPEMPAEPTPDAIDPRDSGVALGVAGACELRYDTPTFAFARGEKAPPLLRGWARPRGEPTDVLFALLSGDIMAPTVFNLGGRVGWAPTVQLTALLRERPAPGWLRIEARTRAVAGDWFDEDVTVVDSAGRLVCQARQLALSPLAP
ncbi:thioesterase family protein [Pseudonocardia sp. DSM 110487]|uniref:thioesterase family protein n=1 Tax=Pseudonocardia sp. DSM 110487 TaxID=2865833 RepID=UPI00210227EA|nr:thioesterase family protein [Pseudonocardia sp. DSM 110487]